MKRKDINCSPTIYLKTDRNTFTVKSEQYHFQYVCATHPSESSQKTFKKKIDSNSLFAIYLLRVGQPLGSSVLFHQKGVKIKSS